MGVPKTSTHILVLKYTECGGDSAGHALARGKAGYDTDSDVL